jgi:hypothetical protein
MQIKNVILKHHEPVNSGAIRKIGGTEVIAVMEDDAEIVLQLEKNLEGETIFYEPSWQIHGTNLLEVVEEIVQWEKQYEEDMKKFNKKYPYKGFDTTKFQTSEESDEEEIAW